MHPSDKSQQYNSARRDLLDVNMTKAYDSECESVKTKAKVPWIKKV